ncbi:hypothetical protein T06_7055 [Trichinella sp. T6]|nr:hypothetical protein T06_7620 [Trichinella sp. T6]KRX80070.1 hypothetical protein T06_7055 [Trichinella sp. T6]KRZ82627.1 hypothetical protein T08_6 [Trichinella sp. T8]
MERNECRMAVRIASSERFVRIERSLMSSECLGYLLLNLFIVVVEIFSSNAARWMEGLRFDWMKN